MLETSKNVRSAAATGMLIALAVALTGCTVLSTAYPVPQSHFTYPNSNVVPIGHCKGSATAVSFMIPTVQDPDLEEKAIQQALAQQGGQTLTDYTQTMTVRLIPLMFLNFYQTTIEVEGTAAKMVEVGKKTLH